MLLVGVMFVQVRLLINLSYGGWALRDQIEPSRKIKPEHKQFSKVNKRLQIVQAYK